MARAMSVAENHHLQFSSSHTARTSLSLWNRIDFLVSISYYLFNPLQASLFFIRHLCEEFNKYVTI